MIRLQVDWDELREEVLAEKDSTKALKMLEPFLEIYQMYLRLNKNAQTSRERKIADYKIDYSASEKQVKELLELLGLGDEKA